MNASEDFPRLSDILNNAERGLWERLSQHLTELPWAWGDYKGTLALAPAETLVRIVTEAMTAGAGVEQDTRDKVVSKLKKHGVALIDCLN